MASGKALSRISLTVAILSWLALVFSDLTVLFSSNTKVVTGIAEEVPFIFRSIYFLALFFFFKYRIEKAESVNFVDLLWRVFVTGLLTTVFSLSLKSIDLIIGSLGQNIFVLNTFYLINLGLASAFVISTFLVWKRLILYQKSKLLMRGWQVFEYGLFFSIIFVFLPDGLMYQIYGITLSILVILGVVLSVNMKWVAYLNFKQKWKSILLLFLILLYMGYFYINITGFEENETLLSLHHNTVLLNAMFIFIFVYSLLSVLVILFNLPTSSVFEQKLGEVVSYQRLSQSIQTETSEEKVYEILLDSAISTVFADAGWLELSQNGKSKSEDDASKDSPYSPYQDHLVYFKYEIEDTDISEIKQILKKNKIRGVFDFNSTDRAVNYSKFLSSLKHSNFKSILVFPLQVQDATIGALVLLKDVSDGFNKEMAEIAHNFVNQAGISIENFRLLTSALENERYREELKIAKKVQNSLLPSLLHSNTDFDIVAFSKAADEVGGDYYDSYQVDENRINLVIGDVSGKGTSAAFNMSQMKGVFHSLSQMDLKATEFFAYANKALSSCLEKTSFITASYFIIDKKKRRVEFARAGHTPTLYYHRDRDQTEFYENKGLGLGILRDDNYPNYLEEAFVDYKSGDVMVLYTDGITEAANFKNEEYGYDKLKTMLEIHKNKTAKEISELIIDDLYTFVGDTNVNDDYTLLVLKFK